MIILSTVILINFCVVLSFFMMVKKNLSIIELFVYWLFSTIPVQNAAALELDFSLVSLSEQQTQLLAYTIDRLVFIPNVIVWFLNDYAGCKTKGSKWLAWLICLIVLIGVEWGGLLIG